MNRRTITYGIDTDTGLVISRVDNEICFLVLDYDGIMLGLTDDLNFNLEKDSVFNTLPYMTVRWTRRIPVGIKNDHRKFWGMKPLKID